MFFNVLHRIHSFDTDPMSFPGSSIGYVEHDFMEIVALDDDRWGEKIKTGE